MLLAISPIIGLVILGNSIGAVVAGRRLDGKNAEWIKNQELKNLKNKSQKLDQ